MNSDEEINRLSQQVRSLKEHVESLRASIMAACLGTKCLNAHELRFNLDEARKNVEILAAEVKAWRAWYEEEKDVNVTDPILYQAVIKAWAATDAAKAMEEKR